MLSPRAIVAARSRLYHGWWMVIGSFWLQILHSALLFLSQGLYVVQLEQTFRWSRGAISWAFGLVRIETGLLGPIQGWMVDRWGARPVMLIGTAAFGGGFLLLSQIQQLWQFFAVMAIIAVGSSLAGFLTIHTAIAHWFRRQRARAMSLTSVGWALGAIAVPLVGWSIVELGWRWTAALSGVAILLVGVPVSLIFRRRPEDYGLQLDGGPAPGDHREEAAAPAATDVDFTLKEAVRERSFWFISIGHGMALLVVGAVPTHLVPHLMERNGWDAAMASLVFPGIMVAQIAGQVSGGILGDLYSKRMVAALSMLGHGGGILILAFDTSVAAVVAAVALHGFAWGARGPLMMAIRADYFGRRNLGLIAGWSNAVTAWGSIAGPVYAGMMHDAFGDYFTAFWTMGVITIASTAFFALARAPLPRPGAEVSGQ